MGESSEVTSRHAMAETVSPTRGNETEAVTRGKVTKENAGSSFGVGTSTCLIQKLRSRTHLQLKLFGEKFRRSYEEELLAGSMQSLPLKS